MGIHNVPGIRRHDKQMTEKRQIEHVIQNCLVCRLALSNENMPYIVPMCFGYRENTLYFHSFPKGYKIDILKINSNVCFEFDMDVALKTAEKPCNFGMTFKSVIGFGRAEFIADPKEKAEALNIIMDRYSPGNWSYSEKRIKATAVFKVRIEKITGKQAG